MPGETDRGGPGFPGYAGSPLTALLAGLGAGAAPEHALGLVIGRPGVGKTALLVHIGLDALFRGRQVLHVALRDTVDHARAHCDEVLRAVADRSRLADAAIRVERSRMIHSFAGRAFDVAALERNLEMLAESAQFVPAMVLVDGLEADAALGVLPVLADLAPRRALVVWASVRLDDAREGDLGGLLDWAALAIRLVPGPQGRAVRLVVAKGGGEAAPALALDPTTLLVVDQDVLRTDAAGTRVDLSGKIQARECTLYSGGAAGAEAAFGEAAERWGAHEVNFTFEGHLQARTRGRYELSPKELAVGDVSLAYVSKRLNRNYNDKGGLIRGVLQTLWHMVSRSQQVFVVGEIQEDGTVHGGTGWSVELARMWSRDLWVFDQARSGWFRWDGVGWTTGTPRIRAMHFCGTGTRYLSPAGKAAVDELFARSFGEGGS